MEAGYAKLKEFREEIPETLTRRYAGKRTGRRTDAERRHKLRLVTIAGVFAAVIIIGLVVVSMLMRANTSRRWADDIHNAVLLHTKAGLDQAQGIVNELQKTSPAMLREREVAAAVNELQVQQNRFATDAQSVKSARENLDAARQAAAPTLANARASMEEIRASSAAIDSALNQAAVMLKDIAWADPDNQLASAIAGVQATPQVPSGTRAGRRGARNCATSIRLSRRCRRMLPRRKPPPKRRRNCGRSTSVPGPLQNLPLLTEDAKSQIADLAQRPRQ